MLILPHTVNALIAPLRRQILPVVKKEDIESCVNHKNYQEAHRKRFFFLHEGIGDPIQVGQDCEMRSRWPLTTYTGASETGHQKQSVLPINCRYRVHCVYLKCIHTHKGRRVYKDYDHFPRPATELSATLPWRPKPASHRHLFAIGKGDVDIGIGIRS